MSRFARSAIKSDSRRIMAETRPYDNSNGEPVLLSWGEK
jgi:hypothetical protein